MIRLDDLLAEDGYCDDLINNSVSESREALNAERIARYQDERRRLAVARRRRQGAHSQWA